MSLFYPVYILALLCTLSWLVCHNDFRDEKGVKDIKWSNKIARSAQKQANRCVQCHQGEDCRVASQSNGYGENLVWSGGKLMKPAPDHHWYALCMRWVNEPRHRGHWKQIVSKQASEVGCGWKDDCEYIKGATGYGQLPRVMVCQYNNNGAFSINDCLADNEYADSLCIYYNGKNREFTRSQTECVNDKAMYYHEYGDDGITGIYYIHWAHIIFNTTTEPQRLWVLNEDFIDDKGEIWCEEEELTDCIDDNWYHTRYVDDGIAAPMEDMGFMMGKCPDSIDDDSKRSSSTGALFIASGMLLLLIFVALAGFTWYRWSMKRKKVQKEMISIVEEKEEKEEIEMEIETLVYN